VVSILSNEKQNPSYLADLMMEVMPKAMQALRDEMRESRGGYLSVPQFRVLAGINRGLTHNKEIGELLGVSEAAISRMIDLLVSEGLVKKGVNKSDRRHTVLSLTTAGLKVFNSAKESARSRLKTKLDMFTSEEADIVAKGLEALQKNMALLRDM